MKNPILLVMAAGIGSRYGGLKQIDPVGQNGEIIIDYSIYDALKAGFRKVIFIVNHDISEDFKETVGNRLEKFIEIEYAYQEIMDIPNSILLPDGRKKPLGTAHAVYSARKQIDGPFCVINADDYYGADAFNKMYSFLSNETLGEYEYAMVGYSLKNTVTDNGYVSRGICDLDDGYSLHGVTERTHIEKTNEGIMWLDENKKEHLLHEDTIVSMNLWGFMPSLIDEIKNTISNFFEKAFKENPLKSEYYLPSVVDKMLKENKCKVKVLHTEEKWYGVTYFEDKVKVTEAINKMIAEGKYPEKLWEN